MLYKSTSVTWELRQWKGGKATFDGWENSPSWLLTVKIHAVQMTRRISSQRKVLLPLICIAIGEDLHITATFLLRWVFASTCLIMFLWDAVVVDSPTWAVAVNVTVLSPLIDTAQSRPCSIYNAAVQADINATQLALLIAIYPRN